MISFGITLPSIIILARWSHITNLFGSSETTVSPDSGVVSINKVRHPHSLLRQPRQSVFIWWRFCYRTLVSCFLKYTAPASAVVVHCVFSFPCIIRTSSGLTAICLCFQQRYDDIYLPVLLCQANTPSHACLQHWDSTSGEPHSSSPSLKTQPWPQTSCFSYSGCYENWDKVSFFLTKNIIFVLSLTRKHLDKCFCQSAGIII